MRTRIRPFAFAAAFALALGIIMTPLMRAGRAQTPSVKNLRPDIRRALKSRQRPTDAPARRNSYVPRRSHKSAPISARSSSTRADSASSQQRRTARPASVRRAADKSARTSAATLAPSNVVAPGTPLSRVLHVSQLSLVSGDGTHEEMFDRTGDLVADDRTTFDNRGGSYDIAVGRTGARYEVFTAIDDRGTTTTSDDVATGILVLALDTNGDFVRDAATTFDLGRDFGFPSAVSVVTGTSSVGREFVVVSSSGFFNSQDPNDPNNEPSPGVVLLVRDPSTGGFDASRTRNLVTVGDDRLFNANAMTLLPSGDLVIADFQSNELRVVLDTNSDGMPDTLASTPYWDFPFSSNAEDAPLDIASNSRGVVFTHSVGSDTQMLAVYDTNGDGFADTDEIRVEGLSIDNNLVLHGMTVARDGTVYVIEDSTGESDIPADGGNGGIPRVDAFPDPALNGILRDGSIFVLADDEFTQAYSGLSFGIETVLPSVGHLTMTNSASLQGDAPLDGLATITGTNLTRGLTGATQSEAASRGVRVSIEGLSVPVLSFNDAAIHIHVPPGLGAGVGSVVVTVGGNVIAAEDARVVSAGPGLFTIPQTGTGEAIALLVSGAAYTRSPFPARTNNQPSEVALLGTGWRNSLPVTVQIGGKSAKINYAGKSGGFPGLDQINAVIPDGVTGAASVVVTTASGAVSRSAVVVTVQ
jgi:uncharacterized protein (TIGR03437 family)